MAQNKDPKIVEFVEQNLKYKKETLAAMNQAYALLEQLKKNPTIEEAIKIHDDLDSAITRINASFPSTMTNLSMMVGSARRMQTIEEAKEKITKIYDEMKQAFQTRIEMNISVKESFGVYLDIYGTRYDKEGLVFKKDVLRKIHILTLSISSALGCQIALRDTRTFENIVETLKVILTQKNIKFESH